MLQCFVDISAPAIQLKRNKILWELFCVVVVLGMIIYFIQMNSKKYKLQVIWPSQDFHWENFDTGDILIAYQGFFNPLQENLFLNPGHLYVVVNSNHYGQKFLWDLTFWNSPTQFKSLTITVQNLLKKRIPVYSIHLKHQDAETRKKITSTCLRKICKNTYNVIYDVHALLEHLGNGMEELAFLPSVCNPFVDININKHYCSLYVFKLLVEFGVLDPRILTEIPKIEGDQVVRGDGGIFYPSVLLHPNYSLNNYTTLGWSFTEPQRLCL
jgi:hypothetical protein